MQLLIYFTTIFKLSVLIFDIVSSDKTRVMYLNSHGDCSGNDDIFLVDVSQKYVVKPDSSPHTKSHSFRDCEITFASVREYGHICLVLVGNEGTITDQNAQLEAKEGFGRENDKVIDTLNAFDTWAHREYCSNGIYITLYLRHIEKENPASIRKVNIEFKVLDIESKERELYLDGSYCSHDYFLENSMVTLWNRPEFPGMTVTDLTSECPIKFDKMDASNHNKSICFAYIPSDDMKCDSNWRFIVSTRDNELDEAFFVYSMRCNASEAKNIHVWCAEPTRSFVTVIFWRNANMLSNTSLEPPKDFRYIVMDYEGTEASLLKKVSSLYGKSDSAVLADKMMIYIGAGVGLVIVVAIVIICCKKRMSYKQVDKEDDSNVL